MRTNIEIDDRLMQDALKATGAKTKREAVELGLRTLVQLRAQEKARELRGKSVRRAEVVDPDARVDQSTGRVTSTP